MRAGERRLELMGLVEHAANRPIDLVVLNHAPNLLQFEVLSRGRLLVERDAAARIAFEVAVGRTYADLAPMRAFFAQAVLAEVDAGGLGERRRSRS